MEYTYILSNISKLLFFVLGAKVALFLFLSFFHYRKNNSSDRTDPKLSVKVSVIVPCFNEETVIKNCLNSLLTQDYENMDIIIVDDGSGDNTRSIAKNLERENKNKITFLSKPNGGKASALNHGILRSSSEIIICIDADSVFLNDTVTNLVRPFSNKRVVAVAGNVRVANRSKLINKHQSIEYISGLNLQRRTFTMLGCPQVISGAIGAFRKDKLIEIGGYSSDTLVEDMDVTISLLEKGGKVVYNGKAIAYTEAPETIRGFIKQRHRWIFGGFQVLKKHKYLIFNPKYKSLGVLGIPYFLIFPWVDVLVSIIFFYSIIKAVLFLNIIELLTYYLILSSLQMILLLYSIFLDKEDEKLALMAVIEGLWYNHLISFITLKAGFNFIKRSAISWNKLDRLGKNIVPNVGLTDIKL